uniref:Integrase catalytic domain-containing protein n=1 Tax=Tanacetum cinerariifolium TaxID=118510 RepID=A0A699HCA2_TANCI|nr:hypothetical protein [Tanacetum cinerariifolium]
MCFSDFPACFQTFKTLCLLNYALMIRHDYDLTSSLRRGALQGMSQPIIKQVTEKIQVAIHLEYPKQTIAIGSALTEEGQKDLCGLLRRNLDIFAWKPADMTGVSRHIAEYRINIREGCLPLENVCGFQGPKQGMPQRWLSATRNRLKVIKSCTEQEVIRVIEETFKTLREINMKLNPKKCTFGTREGTFLGYKVNAAGFKVCPDKVEAVLSFPSAKCLKDVKRLNEKLASLNRFLSKSAKKSLPFFKTLKKCTKKDFIVKRLEDDPPDTPMEDEEELPDPLILFTDGSSCIDGSGAGVIITILKGVQVNGTYIAKEPGMIKYLKKVKALTSTFKEFSIKQVPRGDNKKADALIKMSSTSFAHLSKQVHVEELKEKSIDEKELLAVEEEEGRTWMTPIHEYLTEDILPKEKRKVRAIRCKARRYAITNVSYTKGVKQHACWSKFRGSESSKIRVYRLTMHADARKLIRECINCQEIDIAGPFLEGPGKVKFLIVAIDYFSKWIEAKPVATITGPQIKKFVWDNIVCRFGLPGEIISNNKKQFRDNPFKDWCEKLCIRQCFTSVKHPQANGLVERPNRSLGEGIKARYMKEKKLARINLTCLMGTPYYDQIQQWRNSILANVWNESGDLSRDRHANFEMRKLTW